VAGQQESGVVTRGIAVRVSWLHEGGGARPDAALFGGGDGLKSSRAVSCLLKCAGFEDWSLGTRWYQLVGGEEDSGTEEWVRAARSGVVMAEV
jgi:hypothetical protein